MKTKTEASKFTKYVILLTLNPGKSLDEGLIRGHVAHLRELDRLGHLVMCGPFADYKGGMIVIEADRDRAGSANRRTRSVREIGIREL